MTDTRDHESWPLGPEQRAVLAAAADSGQDPLAAASMQIEVLEIDLEGELDPHRLERALDYLRREHEALHTALCVVPGYRGLRHQALASWPTIAWRHADLRGHQGIRALLDGERDALRQRPLALEQGELLRPALLRTGDDRWVVMLAVASLVADNHGLQSLFLAWAERYDTGEAAVEAQALQYAQFLDWRASLLEDDDAAEGHAHWRALYERAGDAPAFHLPTRLAGTGDGQGVRERIEMPIDAASWERVGRLAESLEVSEPAVLQATWWALLTRIGGDRPALGGWQHDCRHDYAVMDGAMGVFDKVLPVWVDLSTDDELSAWIQRLAEQFDAHTQAQEYWPCDAPHDERHLAVGFAFTRGTNEWAGAGVTWRRRERSGPRHAFELALQVERDEREAIAALYVDPSCYGRATAECLLAQYRTLLDAALASPSRSVAEVELVTREEQADRAGGSSLSLDVGERSVAERVAAWAETTPDAIALTEGGRTLSYAALERRVAAVAEGLRRQGVAPHDRVGLCLPPSIDLVVLLLAIWRVGAAYLPLDPGWPEARRRRVVEDARPVLTVAPTGEPAAAASAGGHDVTLASLDAGEASAAWQPPALQDVAYVLYTSGSTGTPKGVVIEHGQLLNYVTAASQAMSLAECRRWALTGSIATDLGNTALFGALFHGATLVVADAEDMADGEHFARFLDAHQIDALKMVPSHLAALLEGDVPVLPSTLVLGGEAASAALLARVAELAPEARLYNHYGPTEATVGVMVHRAAMAETAPMPLTRTLANCRCHVLDDAMRPVPIGAVGELYIGGAQLARGYLNGGPDAAFRDDPRHPGQRLYRSGDAACVLPEGGIRLLGRTDDQITLRGFRIEPAEIETALLEADGVRQAVVRSLPRGDGERELVAFLMADPETRSADGQERLREHLAGRLPEPMRPTRLVIVDAFPRLANGKVDVTRLPSLGADQPTSQENGAPRDAREAAICEAMAELLGRDALGIDDNFFDLGGHSLLVIKLVARLRKQLDIEIAPGLVFDHPSAAELAQALRREGIALADAAESVSTAE
ncbi:non-ribosomal peptide synthetase [Halomonas sp. B23F22_20]|uniref:non-ribosomal peptide synthetase n=1 Tax=Halomonas sp. B23F22_10 TaxID=3459515 RepID=UPI003748607D